ncbi:DUF6175 family protein [Winogradskyella sp.]|uniref:DUF6175 family protein n=1 Tax=Winogradskyella sp. TaxID=1883156 RepID=UPI00261F5A72|nr:DUF6175 family protein [Winogradskyella sp.]
MKHYIIIAICFFAFYAGVGQEKIVNTVQPTIMVLPFTKEGQDIRTILEEDFNKRIAIAEVKKAFDSRGFTTKDFVGSLKIALKETTLNSGNKTDLKANVIRLSGADFYVEVEVYVQESSSGNSVKLILQGYDSFTGQSLSNEVGESGKFYTDDIAKLSQKAVESCAEEFLNTLNAKFGDIVENGRSVRINIGFSADSEYNMDSEISNDGDLFSDIMEDWLDENSFKNYYHIQGISESEMIIDDYRIPLKDSNGRNYRASKVARALRKYIKSIGLEVKTDMEGSGKINVIIQ